MGLQAGMGWAASKSMHCWRAPLAQGAKLTKRESHDSHANLRTANVADLGQLKNDRVVNSATGVTIADQECSGLLHGSQICARSRDLRFANLAPEQVVSPRNSWLIRTIIA
jgi:hypothetical protein